MYIMTSLRLFQNTGLKKIFVVFAVILYQSILFRVASLAPGQSNKWNQWNHLYIIL